METIAKCVSEVVIPTSWVRTVLADIDCMSRLGQAQETLRLAVLDARAAVQQNPLLEVIAEAARKHAAIGKGEAGKPIIRVLDNGDVVLSLYKGVKPTLQDLQEIAAQRDIDVSGMRKDEVEAALAGKQPKMVKTGLPPVKALDRTGMASRKPPEKVTLTTVPFEEGAGTPDP